MSVDDNNKYLIVKPILNKDGCYIAQEVIDSIPSADVAPVRHGKWIDQDEGAFYPFECSVCRTPPFCNDYGYVFTNYCPNCGARMDGDEE